MRSNIVSLGLLVGLSLFIEIPVSAQQPVPCLIFTGNAQTEKCIDLAKQNRIYFNPDGMTVGSSNGGQDEDVNIAYSDFYRFKIGLGIPDNLSAVDVINIQENTQLVYLPELKSIRINSSSGHRFSVGIYNTNGLLIATSAIYAGQDLPVNTLTEGIYIATATDGENKSVIKFIIK